MTKKHEIVNFYKGKRVLVTGHTGFKGTWLCKMLINAGANVTGYALEAPTAPSLFDMIRADKQITSVIGDIRDFQKLEQTFLSAKPEFVFHLAAQPIVRESYKNPRYTYETNVLGTVNVLDCIRTSESVKSFVNITTDKVYENKEKQVGYREDEPLDGYDPYSNSKSCSELVTHSYQKSFFSDRKIAVSTARAGNVIGGGDFAVDRIVPDCVRAAIEKKEIIVRNAHSIRPYQHVLDPLYAYLMIASRQAQDGTLAGCYNVGPDDSECLQTSKIVDLFVKNWGDGLKWVEKNDSGPHETTYLKLNCEKLKKTFGWKPCWTIETAIQKVIEWTKSWRREENLNACMDRQIEEFLSVE